MKYQLSDLHHNVVIGCTFPYHNHTNNSYYSIDSNPSLNPDFAFDITKINLPLNLKKRFKITLLNNLDFTKYNKLIDENNAFDHFFTEKQRRGAQGFSNILEITKDDGFIFINGALRKKEYRNCVKNLKYIEIPKHLSFTDCIIIPKNQKLSIDDVNKHIKSDEDLRLLIEKLNPYTYFPGDYDFLFCDIKYENLPIITKSYSNIQFSEIELENLEQNKSKKNIKALYEAINKLNSKNKLELLFCADSFFKYSFEVAQKDINKFQHILLSLIQKIQPKIKNKSDYLLIIADILIALTVLGAVAIGVNMYYTKQMYGSYFPVFYGSHEDKIFYNVKDLATKLIS
jgi:hypothetical protein